jgi:hypothetical protein
MLATPTTTTTAGSTARTDRRPRGAEPVNSTTPALDQMLDQIADGVMSLREETRRTLVVLTCLPASWELVRSRAVDTATDRFRVVEMRNVIPDPDSAHRLLVSG